MVDDWNVKTMYATKRRRRSVKAVKPPMKDPPKSNPSKRHRERLNAELDHLASLLPFEQSVISKLDKLSVLRLAVSYLRTKTYFQAALQERYALDGHSHIGHAHHLYSEPGFTDSGSVLQALNGFLFVVTCDGQVFFASRTVEQYLGFHQSDIIHQSALELIHSEDRDEFKTQLNWRSRLPQDQSDMSLQQVLLPENGHLLQRCFTVRFRCLLDNTSGFITLEISGRMKMLHGQSMKGEEPPLALFALCCPFGPLPMLDVPPRDYTFKSKHKMDMAPNSMDPRGKLLFGYSDRELMDKGGYDLIHPDDLSYYSAAHQEMIKTGSSGLIAYRLLTKDFRWIWLQTSSKVIYKNSKPDFVICTHRHLTEDEGRDLVGKRGSEFKLPYPIIDTDPSGFGAALEEDDASKTKNQRSKKSKTQLRDYLQATRKRKTPYRDVYNGINGYSPYAGLNGYPTCQTGDMKADFMYPYGNNLPLDADLYRTGYHTLASSVYPTTDTFRLDTDKHGYANGYYIEPRQYQHTLQYHGNSYTDYVAQSTKYGYDMSKYGYDHVGSYGLDLSKRGHFEEDLSRYESEINLRNYTSDKLARVNGSYDSLRPSSIYGPSAIFNNDGLLSCNMSHNATSCSLYRSEANNLDRYSQDRYSQNNSMLPKENNNSKLLSSDNPPSTDCKQQILNDHPSVIRHPSPRRSPPRSDHMAQTSHVYDSREPPLSTCSSVWTPCSKASNACSKTAQSSEPSETAQSPITQLQPEVASRIVSPAGIKHNNGSATALNGTTANSCTNIMSMATSVIQQSGRVKSCEKQSPVGGIAVPVVKSPSWLHHPLPASSYDWPHLTSTDAYNNHRGSSNNDHMVAAHTRTIVETPKYALARAGEHKEETNPLLCFSEVTHTLLSTN